jgi:hypothetical protein
MSEQAESLKNYLSSRFAESLEIGEEDIEELVEDLSEWNIQDISKFEKHFLYASKWAEGVTDVACEKYAEMYSLSKEEKHYDKLSTLDYDEYLFYFHGDWE